MIQFLLWPTLCTYLSVIAYALPPVSTRQQHSVGARDVVVPSFSSLIPYPQSLLDLVQQRTRDSAHQSWELGVMAEAYLEIGVCVH